MFTLELQKRLPGDRVAGTISFAAVGTLQSEGSEVIVPTPVSERPALLSSMSQDSCFSSDEDHSPLISLHGNHVSPGVGVTHEDDIIPVIIATDRQTSHSGAALSPHLVVDRQCSEPLLPSTIRQVLYGSALKGGVAGGGADESRHASLQRHRSLGAKRTGSCEKPRTVQREQSDPALPPSKLLLLGRCYYYVVDNLTVRYPSLKIFSRENCACL